MKRFVPIVLTVLVIWQGGFPDMAWLICGAAAAVLLIARFRTLPPPILLLFFAGLIGSFVLSAVINGGHMEGWMGTVKCLIAMLWVVALYNVKPDIEGSIFVPGLVAAVAGLLAFSGLLPLPGMMSYGRLQGLFQYANALALFLGVCALLTRLSGKHARYAGLMEAALYLTGSVGGIAVFLGGWALTALTRKEERPVIRAQIPSMLTAALCTAAMFALARWVTPFLAALPPFAFWLLHKHIPKLPRRGWLFWAAAPALMLATVFFAVNGTRPLLTYVSRLIQMGDGINVLLHNPLGLGPGAWTFQVSAWQSAYYDAALIHSGYVALAVDAGWPALMFCALLIWRRLRNRPLSKYGIAVCMVLFHALFDISLSFLAVILLLCMLGIAELPEGRTHTRRFRTVWVIPCLLCMALALPLTVKNRASWAARDGSYAEAVKLLDTGILESDTEAQMMRLRWSVTLPDVTFDQAFAALKDPNAEAYALRAGRFLRQRDIGGAARMAELCIQNAPYVLNGYTIMERVMEQMEPGPRGKYAAKLDEWREAALARMHPWAKYIQDEQGLR